MTKCRLLLREHLRMTSTGAKTRLFVSSSFYFYFEKVYLPHLSRNPVKDQNYSSSIKNVYDRVRTIVYSAFDIKCSAMQTPALKANFHPVHYLPPEVLELELLAGIWDQLVHIDSHWWESLIYDWKIHYDDVLPSSSCSSSTWTNYEKVIKTLCFLIWKWQTYSYVCTTYMCITTHLAFTFHITYTVLCYTTLNYNVHYQKWNYTALHCNTFHYTTLHYVAFHYIKLQIITLVNMTLHYITPHYTTPLCCMTLHQITTHYNT